jgi:hypothetical protein
MCPCRIGSGLDVKKRHSLLGRKAWQIYRRHLSVLIADAGGSLEALESGPIHSNESCSFEPGKGSMPLKSSPRQHPQ